MDHFISMYIDNELSLDEKIFFLEKVHADNPYKEDAISLLEQEKLLHASLNKTAPDVEINTGRPWFSPLWNRSLGWAVAACLLVVMAFLIGNDFRPVPGNQPDIKPITVEHRFIIQQQGSSRIEIAGSFTNWNNVPLMPTGTSGYWEVYLDLPPGEHRYTFIVDGKKYLPDPTVSTQETDDFGSTNSILAIEV